MEEKVKKAAEVVRDGGVILYPTDTIWGLGCDPKNEEAIDKIARLKMRPESKSFIVLVPNETMLQRYVKEIPEVCFDILDYAERPITIIYPTGQYVSDKILAKDGSVAIRMTKDPFCVKLMGKIKSGIISTSANISGQPHAKSLDEIAPEIKNNVDYIVDLPLANPNAKPSQILKVGLKGEIEIIRK